MPDHDSMVHLDGTTLEGGGQLLRLALSLSSLTHKAIHVTDIRGRRGSLSARSEGGGLKGSHLAAVKWLAHCADATLNGAEVKSKELIFEPSHCVGEIPRSGGTVQSPSSFKKAKAAGQILWQDRYDGDRIVRKESFVPASTPGSIFLIFQAILPYILFSAPLGEHISQTIFDEQQLSICHRLIIEGGTNVSKSPSYEYIDQVLLPMLRRKVGIPEIKMTMDKRGWTQGRTEVGRVTFDITPLPVGSMLPSFEFTKRGKVARFYVSILAPEIASRQSIRQTATEEILKRYPEIDIDFPVDEDSMHPKRLYLLLVAETSEGFRLGRDWMYDRKATASTAQQKNKQLVEMVLNELEKELEHGGCVDEYMQDQLVVFQALVEGRAKIDYGKGQTVSLHTQTARWVAEQVLGMKFEETGMCEGQAFRVGERFGDREGKATHRLSKDIEKLQIADEPP